MRPMPYDNAARGSLCIYLGMSRSAAVGDWVVQRLTTLAPTVDEYVLPKALFLKGTNPPFGQSLPDRYILWTSKTEGNEK